jgi:hypothetical protein
VLIGSVRVAGESYLAFDLGQTETPRFELEPALNQLRIEFFALGAGPSDGIRYQCRLEGADRNWNGPTERRDVNYASLSPGRYRFVVRAVAADGALSQTPASVEFTILRPIWQRRWFLGSAVLGVLFLIFAGHSTRQATLARAGTRPHANRGGSARRYRRQPLAHFDPERGRLPRSGRAGRAAVRRPRRSPRARGVVDALGDVVWSVDPRETIRERVPANSRCGDDLFAGNGVRWTYNVAGNLAEVKLDPQARRNLFLLLKEVSPTSPGMRRLDTCQWTSS